MTQWRGIKNEYTIFWHLIYKTQIYWRQRRKWYQSGRSLVLLSSSRMCLCRQTRRRTMCCCWCCWVYLPGGRWSCSPCCSSFVIGAVSGDDATQGLCPLWHLPDSVSLQAHGKGCQIQRLGVVIAVSNSPISLQSQRWPREDQHHLCWGFSAHSRLDRLFFFFIKSTWKGSEVHGYLSWCLSLLLNQSEITIHLDESDALSATSCHDGESERFVSTGSTGRRVSFNESALYEQDRATQDKSRRYQWLSWF